MRFHNQPLKKPSAYAQWHAYNDTYIGIQKNKRKRAAMHNDPGVRWMSRGWMIVFFIVAIIYCIGKIPM